MFVQRLAIFAVAIGWACSARAVSLETKARLSPVFEFATGVAFFPDLYVPLVRTDPFNPHLRADGVSREADTMKHTGLMLMNGFALQYQLEKFLFSFNIKYMQAKSFTADGLYEDSGYSLFSTSLHNRYKMFVKLTLDAGISFQRLAFSNISHGHTLFSVLPEVGFSALLPKKISLSCFFGYAPYNRLGYFRGVQFFGKKIAKTRVGVRQFGLTLKKEMSADINLVFSATQKDIDLHFADINSYKSFGFNLLAPPPSARNYKFKIRTASFGITKGI